MRGSLSRSLSAFGGIASLPHLASSTRHDIHHKVGFPRKGNKPTEKAWRASTGIFTECFFWHRFSSTSRCHSRLCRFSSPKGGVVWLPRGAPYRLRLFGGYNPRGLGRNNHPSHLRALPSQRGLQEPPSGVTACYNRESGSY